MKNLLTVILLICWTSVAAGQDIVPGLALADSFWSLGQRDSALSTLEGVAERARQRENAGQEVQALTTLGARQIAIGCSAEAIGHLQRAIALATAQNDTLALLPAVRWLSLASNLQGQSARADSLFQRLFDLASAAHDERYKGWACIGFASRWLEKGLPREASRWYEQAANHLEKAGEPAGELWARNGLGIALNRQRRHVEALKVYQMVAQRAQAAGAFSSLVNATNNIGNLQLLLGDPAAAQAAFRRTVSLADSLGLAQARLTGALNLALCEIQLGNLTSAADILDRNLAFCRKQNLTEQKGQFLLEKGRLEEIRRRPQSARRYREMAMAMGDTLPVRERSKIVADLARSALRSGSPDEAYDLLTRGRKQQPQEGLGAVTWELDLLMARTLLDLGRTEKAYDLLTSLDRELDVSGPRHLALRKNMLLARALEASHRPGDAAVALQKALVEWEQYREAPGEFRWREVRAAAGREAFLRWAWLYQNHPELLSERGNEEIFDTLQHYKARTFLDRLAGPAFSDSLAAEVPSLATLSDLRQKMKPGDLALDWYTGPERSLLLAVTVSDLKMVWLPSESVLAGAVNLYLDLITGPDLSPADRLAPLRKSSQALAKLLLGPARDLVVQSQQIISCADGPLQGLPLEVLCWSAGCDSLCMRQSWRSTPVLSLLTRPESTRPSAGCGMLALGGSQGPDGQDFAGVRRELDRLAHHFKNTEVLLAGPDGPPLNLSILSNRSIIHIASHMMVDNLHPWQSAIDLPFTSSEQVVGSGQVVGPLTASALLPLPLNNNLTVLNGCSSAGGRVLPGEGSLGLATSFLVGGSRCVVATLWQVSDQTAETFSRFFYHELEQGETVGEALAQTRARMRSQAGCKDPAQWGAYVVYGDPDQRVVLDPRANYSKSFWVIVLLAGAFISSLLWMVLHARR